MSIARSSASVNARGIPRNRPDTSALSVAGRTARRAEQERHGALVGDDARSPGDRDVDHGVRTPPWAIPFASRPSRGGSTSVKAIGCPVGAGSPARTQVFSAAMAACSDVVVLWGEIDAVGQPRTHQLIRRRIRRDDVGHRHGSGVDEPDADRVVVGMGGTGNLPRPKSVVVGASGRVVSRARPPTRSVR